MPTSLVIADDEAPIRLLVEQALEKLEDEGVELHMACDGAEALELIRQVRPQMAIIDVMMPRVNGFDVCRAVKDDPALSGTYVLLLTAKGQQSDRETGHDAGADLYMTKPFNPAQLRALAADVLGIVL